MKSSIVLSIIFFICVVFFAAGKYSVVDASGSHGKKPKPTVTPTATPVPVPYQCGADLCQGYRCVTGTTVDRSCYNSTEILSVSCAGSFVFIPTFTSCNNIQYYWNY